MPFIITRYGNPILTEWQYHAHRSLTLGRRARVKDLLISELATSRNATPETAEGMVVKSLAKAKLQFPVMTEKFGVAPAPRSGAFFVWDSFRRATSVARPFSSCPSGAGSR